MHTWVKLIKQTKHVVVLAALICLMLQSCGDEDKASVGPTPDPNPPTWQKVENMPTSVHLRSVGGSSSTDVYAVGKSRTVLHYSGKEWDLIDVGAVEDLVKVLALAPNNVFILGTATRLYTYDGSKWQTNQLVNTNKLLDIHGAGPSSIFTVGLTNSNELFVARIHSGTMETVFVTTGANRAHIWCYSATNVTVVADDRLIRYDGSSWEETKLGTSQTIRDIDGFGSHTVWTVGDDGRIRHFNGNVWHSVPSGINTQLMGIYCPDDVGVFIVGNYGKILRFDGVHFKQLEGNDDANTPLFAVWGSSATNVWAVGLNGTILHYSR